MESNATCMPQSNDTLHEMGPPEVFMWFALYGSVAFLAVVGNLLVIAIITRRQRMHTVVNFLIVNLAAADALTGLLAIPFKFQAALLQKWVLFEFMCTMIPFIEQVSLSVSVCTLCIMAVDRFLSVRLKAAKMTFTRAYWLVIGTWALSIAASVPFGHYHRMTDIRIQGPNGTCVTIRGCQPPLSSKLWNYYNIALVVFQYFLPLVIVNISYCWIAYKIWLTEPPELGGDHGRKFFQNKKRVSCIFLQLCSCFL